MIKPTREELKEMCVDNMTQSEIGEICGVLQGTVSKWIKSYEIETNIMSRRGLANSLKPSEEELYEMYYVKKMSMPKISCKIGVSLRTIARMMKEFGIESRTISESKLDGETKPSAEELYEVYYVKKMSVYEIENYTRVSWSTITRIMKEFSIAKRSRSDFIGELSSGWQGGISFEPYCYKFNRKFKESVRVRDKYECQLCRCSQDTNGKKLSIHHIHYDKKNCYPDVVALCCSCNSSVNGNRDYWEEFFMKNLDKRELLNWSCLNA